MRKIVVLLFILSIFSACSNNTESTENRANNPISFAVLYNYYATEYQALSLQAYNIAEERIRKLESETFNVSKLAIVLDIDETVFDNSPYQAAAVIGGFNYPEKWNEWCNQAEARAVPGSLKFLELADSLSFNIFYISNRKYDYVYDSTLKNLTKLGFPQANKENLLLRRAKSENNPDPSDKENRRQEVRDKGLEIVMLIGDNMGDFYSDSESLDKRTIRLKENLNNYGSQYIVLPNPMYGNWPASINLDGSAQSILKKLQKMAARLEDS